MIDARNTFRQINTTLRDFSPEQMTGLTAIIKSYRGENVSSEFDSNPWLKEHYQNGQYENSEGSIFQSRNESERSRFNLIV